MCTSPEMQLHIEATTVIGHILCLVVSLIMGIVANSFPSKHTDLFGCCSPSRPAGCCSSWVILLLHSHAFGSAFISVDVLLLRQNFPFEASLNDYRTVSYGVMFC